ncbi:MAG: hypothetical protein ACI8PP_002594 [Candidatus Pseudothioglobus sp.]|jgi:hypothetical protein
MSLAEYHLKLLRQHVDSLQTGEASNVDREIAKRQPV